MNRARPNRALRLARERVGLSRYALAVSVADASQGQITWESADRALRRIESGSTRAPSEIYQQLICRALHESPATLFGRHAVDAELGYDSFTTTCRKYVPVIVPVGAANRLAHAPGMRATEVDGVTAYRAVLDWPHDDESVLHVTVFGFGAVIAELRETLEFESLADLAVWRHTTWEIDRSRIAALLTSTWPVITSTPQYVLGTWWLARPCWDDALDTAVRIMSTPSILLDRQGNPTAEELHAGAEVAEQALMTSGLETGDDIIDFGASGVSIGYASWSGIAYAPLAVDRALHPDELGDFETLAQGLWALCDSICSTVERGDDPLIEDGYGWRWLRGITTRLTRPRPTETRQVQSMRGAVVRTSQLGVILPETVSVLRDSHVSA